MSVAAEIEAANTKYAASFTKGDLQLPPRRKVAIVACMDARLGKCGSNPEHDQTSRANSSKMSPAPLGLKKAMPMSFEMPVAE